MTRVLFAALLTLMACGEAAVDPAILAFTVDPGNVAAGGTVQVMVELEGFTLTGHDMSGSMSGMDMDMDMDMDHDDHDHHSDGTSGHIHIYLDDVETNPLAMMGTSMAEITIPVDTEVGAHTLIARLHDASHLILDPEVVETVDLDVTEATVTGGTSGTTGMGSM